MRPARKILGVDPGQHGALVFLGMDGRICEIEDMPVIGKLVNGSMCSRLIQGYGPVEQAVVEAVHSMPKQGVASAFNFGMNYGKILGVLETLEIPVEHMTPTTWKKRWNIGNDKNAARQRATNRWPTWADHFNRVKDDGRAEAALLAATWLVDSPQSPRRIIKRQIDPD